MGSENNPPESDQKIDQPPLESDQPAATARRRQTYLPFRNGGVAEKMPETDPSRASSPSQSSRGAREPWRTPSGTSENPFSGGPRYQVPSGFLLEKGGLEQIFYSITPPDPPFWTPEQY